MATAISLSSRAFQFFPGLGPIHEGWMILALLALLALYMPWRIRVGGRPESFEVYLALLLVFIPLASALTAQMEFGQPLIYGLLAQRGMALAVGVPLLTYQLLMTRRISLEDIERVLLWLAWGTLALYTAMALLLEPSSYFAEYGLGFVSGGDPSTSRFKFDPVFIVFGFFYYAFQGFRCHRRSDFLRSALFLLFTVVVIQGRSLSLCLIAAYLWFAVRWTKNKSRLPVVLGRLGLVIGILTVGLYFVDREFFESLTGKFADAFTVAFTGEYTDDPSANARIDQTILALPYIVKNWLLGSGRLSNQWNEGFKSAMGYFYPDDIGIVGVVFLHGVVGTLLFAAQFVFSCLFRRGEGPARSIPLMDATKGFVLFYAIRSLATAQFVYRQEALLFFIALLWAYSKLETEGGFPRWSRLPRPDIPSSRSPDNRREQPANQT